MNKYFFSIIFFLNIFSQESSIVGKHNVFVNSGFAKEHFQLGFDANTNLYYRLLYLNLDFSYRINELELLLKFEDQFYKLREANRFTIGLGFDLYFFQYFFANASYFYTDASYKGTSFLKTDSELNLRLKAGILFKTSSVLIRLYTSHAEIQNAESNLIYHLAVGFPLN